MSLNGWQRLWVSLTVLGGVLACYSAIAGYPDTRWIDAEYEISMMHLTPGRLAAERKTAGQDNPYATPEEDLLPIPEELEKRKARVVSKYEKDVKELPGKQRQYLYAVFGVWLGASLGLYLFGWAVGWVIRGFRKPNQD